MTPINQGRFTYIVYAPFLFLLVSSFAYKIEKSRENFPFVLNTQPKSYTWQPNLPRPIPWNTFVALYSKLNRERETMESAVCNCAKRSDEERPEDMFVNLDCPDQSMNDKLMKCAQMKGIYCEHNEKCYTRAIRGLNYFSARDLCQSYNKIGVTSTLLKEQDLTPGIVQHCLPLYTAYFDIEFWHHDDNVTAEAIKCPSLEIEFKSKSWTVSQDACRTSDYAVCQITFE